MKGETGVIPTLLPIVLPCKLILLRAGTRISPVMESITHLIEDSNQIGMRETSNSRKRKISKKRMENKDSILNLVKGRKSLHGHWGREGWWWIQGSKSSLWLSSCYL
ncbi:hypothetical protein M9H77_07145 [Catharanthus roseus]|uniref:Uncharacterized protein n=1 Tax=Catharanthus roseus TaxID=4058 RepID=A0ACC0BU47_CATRO|nr:hypothetical protein M9H77_07145 [Catharanthus roseus]